MDTATTMTEPYLSSWEFYSILAIAALTSVVIVGVWKHFRNPPANAEWFITSGRNLQTGITSASLVAFWTGISSTLIVTKLGYELGLSAVYGYAVGMAAPLLLLIPFSLRLKKDTPLAHTLPEWIRWRFDARTHKLVTVLSLLLTLWYALFALLLSIHLIQGFTGLDPYLLLFLLVAVFTIYTAMGGLHGSILTGYVQCSIIVVIALSLAVFFCNRYGDIGIYEKLSMRQESLGLQMRVSPSTIIMVGAFSILLHLGLTFVHQPVWQRCIATTPRSHIQVLLVAGFASFAISIALGTVFGLGGQALGIPSDQSSGIMAVVLNESLGHNALLLFILIIVMATFAIGSAELVGGVSILVTDLYKHYWARNTSDEHLLSYARTWMILLGIGLAILGSYLISKDLPVQWFYFTGSLPVISVVPPILLGMFWQRMHGKGAFWGVLLGLFAAISGWIVAAQREHGAVNAEALFDMSVLTIGNLAGFAVSVLFTVVLSLMTRPPKRRPVIIDSFLSSKDIREQDIRLRFSFHSYIRYIHRVTDPIASFVLYFILAVSFIWIVLIPLLIYLWHPRLEHGMFVMWLIGALVCFLLTGGYLLLAPIIDVFQGEDPIVLAFQSDEEEEHVSEPED